MLPHRVNSSIVLRMLQNQHAEELFEVTDRNRAHLRRWLPWLDETTEVAHSREFIANALKAFTESGVFICGIWNDDVLCGAIGYNYINWQTRTAYPGYWLAEDHQGRGIATLCCQTMIHHAFQEYRLDRITIHVATENYRSQAIPERLGFYKDGIHRNAEWLYHRFVDHTIYRLDRK